MKIHYPLRKTTGCNEERQRLNQPKSETRPYGITALSIFSPVSDFEWFRKLDIARSNSAASASGISNVKASVPTCPRLSNVAKRYVWAQHARVCSWKEGKGVIVASVAET